MEYSTCEDYGWDILRFTLLGYYCIAIMTSEKQVALIVGASRGIGRQVAIDLGKNGYTGISKFCYNT